MEAEIPLSIAEQEEVYKIPTNYLLCYLNGYTDVVGQLKKTKNQLKGMEDKTTYVKYKETMRVLRKVKYH